MVKVSQNAQCPCGSGKKYKKCCSEKGINYSMTDNGKMEKGIPLSDEAVTALEDQKKAFIKKFGREPGPSDPVFFNPDSDTPEPINTDRVKDEVVKAMQVAGIPPALIYAYKKTGFMVTEANRDLMDKKNLEEWTEAIDEYEEE